MNKTKTRKPEIAQLRQLDDAQLAQVIGGDGGATIQADTEEAHKSGSLVYLNRTRQKEL